MAPYIHSVRNGIHIINLPRSIQAWSSAQRSIIELVGQGGSVLFVGTKKQAQDAMATESKRCDSFFVSQRWLGGMLTNFATIRKSIDRMKKVEEILKSEEEAQAIGQTSKFTKKERLMLSRELTKLNFSLGGIREMTSIPQMLFVVDVKREEIAVKEAKRLDIPVVALVDTNCDPRVVTHPIPSNDDGSRAIKLFAQAVSDAVIEGKRLLAENIRLGKVVLAQPQAQLPEDAHQNRRPRRDNRDGGGRRQDDRRGAQGSSSPAVSQVAAPAVVAVEAPVADAVTTEGSEKLPS